MPGMEDFRRSIRAIAIVTFTCGTLLVLYLLAYRFTGIRSVQTTEEFQTYEHRWQATLFGPAGNIEGFIRNKKIQVAYVGHTGQRFSLDTFQNGITTGPGGFFVARVADRV